jgi:Uma2 family endonuclease
MACFQQNLRNHLSVVGSPDLVVEILSPSTARYDQGDKLLRYARSGVFEMWIIDPDDRHVEVYRFDREAPLEPERVLKGEVVLRTGLLPGFALPLGRLFCVD